MKPLWVATLILSVSFLTPPIFAARNRAISLPPSPLMVSAPSELGTRSFETYGSNSAPAVAPSGDGFVAAWAHSTSAYPQQNLVQVTRIEPDGAAAWGAPSVLWSGVKMALGTAGPLTLIAELQRSCGIHSAQCFASVSAVIIDGHANVRTGELMLGQDAALSSPISVASDGQSFCVVWQSGDFQIRTVVVGLDGSIVRPATSTGVTGDVQVSADAGGYALAWSDGPSGLRAARVLHDGTLGTPVIIDLEGVAPSQFSIGGNGSQHVIAWHASDGIRVELFDPSLRRTGERITIDASGADMISVAAQPGGTFVVGYHTPSGVYAVRISSSGELEVGPRLLLEGASSEIAIAQNGDTVAIVEANDVANARLFSVSDLSLVSQELLSKQMKRQGGIAGACSTTECCALWSEAGAARLHAGVIGDDGRLPRETVTIGDGTISEHTIAFDGENYVIAWIEADDPHSPRIRASRLSQSGFLLDAVPLQVSIGDDTLFPRELTSVSAGDQVLVAWTQWSSASMSSQIVGARMRHGVVLDPGGKRLVPNSVDQVLPALAWDGSAFMIAWLQQNIFVARLDSDAQIVSDHIPVANRPWDPQYHQRPVDSLHISWNGAVHLLTWRNLEEKHDVSDYAQMRGARVSREGQPLDGPLDADGFLISDWPNDAWYPSTSPFDGGFLVAWMSWWGPPVGVRVSRVTDDGSVLEGPAGVPLLPSNTYAKPTLVGRSDGTARLFTEEMVNDLEHGDTTRVFVRSVTPTPVR